MISPATSIERVEIDSVSPHPDNPREGDVGAIAESLLEHGQYRPIVVQSSTRRILAGNHTWRAAKSIGWSQIDAVGVDVDDEQALRILLVDNRASDLGNYDDRALVALLTDLAQQTDGGLVGTGYDGDALDRLIADLSTDLRERDDAIPAGERLVQFTASDVRQLVVIVGPEDFARLVAILKRMRADEGYETNSDAIVSLLDGWDRAHPA